MGLQQQPQHSFAEQPDLRTSRDRLQPRREPSLNEPVGLTYSPSPKITNKGAVPSRLKYQYSHNSLGNKSAQASATREPVSSQTKKCHGFKLQRRTPPQRSATGSAQKEYKSILINGDRHSGESGSPTFRNSAQTSAVRAKSKMLSPFSNTF